MIAHKHIEKIAAVIVTLAVVFCFAAMMFAGALTARAGGAGVGMEYETKLFDAASPLTINLVIDETDWEEMLSDAMSETYHSCNVEMNGQTFYNVGIRPKGNTSLSSIAMNPDTDRYSFKLEFDRFVDGQTCFGLDKLVLNNNYADATNMKEALIYDMYRYIGADAALSNYAKVCVNGEYWGVYLALEAVEDSFLLRNYGVSSGKLYKPESMDRNAPGREEQGANGRGRPGGMDIAGPGESGLDSLELSGADLAKFDPRQMDFGKPDFPRPGGNPGPSMGGNGANLNYSDDDLDSYSTIWEGEVTGTGKADHQRVVTALKNISEGTDLERYMDIDNLLRYMAVHVFSVNQDSLTGNMAHNYYLYEKNGRLNLIPWDYNLSWGGMGGGKDASGVINSPIDNAFSGTNFFDTLMENTEYYNQYHACLQELVDGYVNGGAFDRFYARARALLDELVETDPTAFYSGEEYRDAAGTLYEVIRLRGQSVLGQLDGAIPSTQAGQREDNSALIDTGNLDLSIMGSMNMGNGDMGGGGGFAGFGGGFRFGGGGLGATGFDPSRNGAPPDGIPNMPEPAAGGAATPAGGPNFAADGAATPAGGPNFAADGAATPAGGPNFAADGAATPAGGPNFAAGGAPPANGGTQSDSSGAASPERPASGQEEAGNDNPGQPGPGNMNFDPFPGAPSASGTASVRTENLITYGICFAILIAALLFAQFFKRRSRKI